ncbi:hypothetical protein AAVH_14653 [Aphelenchoides avenae]|nr:hypothetical protein AAVH_14653 [Aphelenchus avenae]
MNFMPPFCTANQQSPAMSKKGPTFSDALRHPRRSIPPVAEAASAQSGHIVRLQGPLTIRKRGLPIAPSPPPEQSRSPPQPSNEQNEITDQAEASVDACVKVQEIPHSTSASDFEKIEVDTAKSCSEESDAAGSSPDACSPFIAGAVNACWETSGSASPGDRCYGSLEHAVSYINESFLEVSKALYSQERAAEAVDFKEELLSVLHKYERRLRGQK